MTERFGWHFPGSHPARREDIDEMNVRVPKAGRGRKPSSVQDPRAFRYLDLAGRTHLRDPAVADEDDPVIDRLRIRVGLDVRADDGEGTLMGGPELRRYRSGG